jgi:hypothetical protein
MKNLMPVVVALLISSGISAQYKKASFFGKAGRTYEIGSQMYMFGDGKGSPIGFKIGFGRDQDGRRFFSSWEIQYIPSYKYSFTTTDYYSNEPVNVNGTTKPTWVYALNYSFHILRNEEEQRMVMPFVSAGLNIVLSKGVRTESYDPASAFPVKGTVDKFTSGIGAGLGTIINITPTYGFKLQGGYNHEFSLGTSNQYDENPYDLHTSHPYVSLTFRARLVSE